MSNPLLTNVNEPIEDLEHLKFKETAEGRAVKVSVVEDSTTGGGSLSPGTQTIYNASAVSANTEYSQSFPSNTKAYLIKCRDNAKIQFSFTSGQSNTLFITIPAGGVYFKESVNLVSTTLYFQTNKANQVVEVLTWS